MTAPEGRPAYEQLPTSGDEGAVWDTEDWRTIFEGTYAATEPEWFTTDGQAVEAIKPSDVAEVEAWHVVSHQECADQDIVALMRLHDGRYATVTSWSDSSGYGCQDATYWRVATDRETAISMGLDASGRERLSVPLPGERTHPDAC